MLEFLKDYPKEDLWLVVDGYHFNENYHHKLKNIESGLIVFDDIGHLKFYSADIIINQNIFAKKLNTPVQVIQNFFIKKIFFYYAMNF